MFLIEKDESGKYNFPDSLSLKTKGYQWYVKNNCGEGCTILKVKNLESKHLVSRDLDRGEVSGLWAVTSSSSDVSRLQDRARERLLNRACPSSTTFDAYVKMRTSCRIIEQRDGDYLCDCFEGCKGKLCQHSNGMRYVNGDLVPEADVRVVPLGAKRKRGRPKRNPMCLTRSPPKSTESASIRNDIVEDVSFINEDQSDSLDDHPEGSGLNKSPNDLCHELESDTDEDDGMVSKKTRRVESKSLEIQPPAVQPSSSGASANARETSRGRPRGRAGGIGRPRKVEQVAPPDTSSTKRRGRPRGSARGRSTRGRPRSV